MAGGMDLRVQTGLDRHLCGGVGALAHDYGFSLEWVLLSTVLVWTAPAQVILLSALGAGASPLEAALAVGL
jgi:predicted branched-subunit amino acid permease